MKIKVWHMASDTKDGTQSEVFGTKEALHKRQEEIIRDSLPSSDPSGDTYEIRKLLDAAEIDEAWDEWEFAWKPGLSTYCIEESEVEVPIIYELVNVLKGEV